MVKSIPGIFKSERHTSSASMWSNNTETSNGRSRGSYGTTLGGSCSTMDSLLVSLNNIHVFFRDFQRPFLMELCIVVLECLVQVMTWLPNSSMFLSHVQHRLCWDQRSSRSLRFNITVNSSFGL